jgi:small-conductance mechanosensitive channel
MIHTIIHDMFDPTQPIGALVYGLLFLFAALAAAKLLRLWSLKFAGHFHGVLDPTAASFLRQLMTVSCFVGAIILYAHVVPALNHIGTALLASAGLVSLVIGLAAQTTLGNLIAGFSLLLYRPFDIGDVLTVATPTGKETGTVKEFALGHTKLLTEDGRWVIVPNSVIASNVIIRVK